MRRVSLSGDGLVLSDGDILTDAAESTNAIVELLRGMDALSEWERVGIVEELHLSLSSFSIVDSTDTWVLLVKP